MLRCCACPFILILFLLSVSASNSEISFRHKRFPKYELPKFRTSRDAAKTFPENGKEDINSNNNEIQSNISQQQSLRLFGDYRNLPEDTRVDVMVMTEEKFDMNEQSTIRNDITLDDEKSKEELLNELVFVPEQMNESILLHRNNCNLEIEINEWEDRKLSIQYEDLQNGISGQCETTLSCKNNKWLAVFVTNINFGKINGEKGINVSNEVLRVISSKNNFNFTLKQYDGNDKYYPVILTDADKVFLIFSFGGKASFTNNATFNLEVFNYYSRRSRPILHDFNINGESGKDIETIFITTVAP